MKKSLITKLGAGVLVAVLLCGCQMGPSDEKLISTTMANWKAAVIAQDLDKIMEAYSENYESAEGSDKESERENIASAIESGYLDDFEVYLENAKITIRDDKARVCPVVVFIRSEGAIAMEFTLQKEDSIWRIVSSKEGGESH